LLLDILRFSGALSAYLWFSLLKSVSRLSFPATVGLPRRLGPKEAPRVSQQAAQQATQQQLDDFKKPFSVCLEAKEYMVE
jgi:hypothetical protein